MLSLVWPGEPNVQCFSLVWPGEPDMLCFYWRARFAFGQESLIIFWPGEPDTRSHTYRYAVFFTGLT